MLKQIQHMCPPGFRGAIKKGSVNRHFQALVMRFVGVAKAQTSSCFIVSGAELHPVTVLKQHAAGSRERGGDSGEMYVLHEIQCKFAKGDSRQEDGAWDHSHTVARWVSWKVN